MEVLDNEFYKYRDCMCKCCFLYYGDCFYYIFYRKCVCGEYINRFFLFEYIIDWFCLFIGYIKIKGIDIYGDENCIYEYLDIWGG